MTTTGLHAGHDPQLPNCKEGTTMNARSILATARTLPARSILAARRNAETTVCATFYILLMGGVLALVAPSALFGLAVGVGFGLICMAVGSVLGLALMKLMDLISLPTAEELDIARQRAELAADRADREALDADRLDRASASTGANS